MFLVIRHWRQWLILPRGITGFNVPKGYPKADPASFRADCWQVVAPLCGRVEDRQQVLYAPCTNFLTQVLVLAKVEATVLLNKMHPWLGFCRPLEPGDCSLEFIDPGTVPARFAALGRYRVLSREELDQPVSSEMIEELGSGESHQIKYWSKLAGPGKLRVGQVVFNFWD